MTTVSIYDDIDPGVKKESGPVDLYGQLHISAPTGPPKGMVNNRQPPNTASMGYNHNPHHTVRPPARHTPNLSNPQPPRPPIHQQPRVTRPPAHNMNRKPVQPTIINHPPSQMGMMKYPPPHNETPVDPALTGIPIAHQATFRSHVLYVGGLSWWVSDADLRHVFEQFGDITEIKVHADKVNGKSKGYGYVEYAQRDIEGAVSAKQKLNGHLLADCRITVAFAIPERAKGVEYTNTPVHIPRKRVQHHHHHNHLSHLNRGHHPGIHRPQLRIGPATVIPTPQIGIPSALSTVSTLGGATRGLLGNNGALSNVVKNANGNTSAGGGGGGPVIKSEKGATGGTGGAANILSKFTNQSQLLALLSKANGAHNRSASRSPSGSRSRSRSRSRSKHRRRRHHKKGSRSSAERRGDRGRDRGDRGDRHRGGGRGSGSDRGRDGREGRDGRDRGREGRAGEERKDREGREGRDGREERKDREHRRRREHGDEKGGDGREGRNGVVEEEQDREKRRHRKRHRHHHREKGDRDRHRHERGDRSRRRRSDGSGAEEENVAVTTTSITDGRVTQ